MSPDGNTTGSHRLSVSAEGIPGGCNRGRLLSRGGMLTVWTSAIEPNVTIERTVSPGDVIFVRAQIGYGRGGGDAFVYIDGEGTVRRSAGIRPRQPLSDDDYYGRDWLFVELATGSIVSHIAKATLNPYRSLAHALTGRLAAQLPPRPAKDRRLSTTVTAYVWDAAPGAYRRIVLAERAEK